MRSVLIVEDEATVRNGLSILLEMHGFQPLCAGSTQEALEVLKDSGVIPNAIVADYRLRNGDTGVAAVRAVRHQLREDVPGLIISGEADPGRRAAVTDSGLPMLHKPVSPEILMTTLDLMLADGGRR